MPVVKFYASFRKLIGIKEKVVPGATIRVVLETLAGNFPDLKNLIDDGDRIRAILTLNGHTLDPLTAFDTAVSEKDQIAIFPPISGG
jgi:molybdopterin synthase sulfur carrier subunit